MGVARQRLYGAGARRMMVAGLPPIGCVPIQVTLSNILPSRHWLQRVCNLQVNTESQAYNVKLQSHIHLLQSSLTDAKVAYFDIYTPILDMVLTPAKYGIINIWLTRLLIAVAVVITSQFLICRKIVDDKCAHDWCNHNCDCDVVLEETLKTITLWLQPW